MFTLLKVPEVFVANGIHHLRNDGTTVEVLSGSDANLVCTLPDDNETYAFFIINSNSDDIVRYDHFSHRLLATTEFNEQDVYLTSCEILEMCKQLLEQNRPLPANIDNLLKDKLAVFFSNVIQFEGNGFNSSSIWENYEWILKRIEKNANEYVPQAKIDDFINQLNAKHEIEQVEQISTSKSIDISLNNIEAYIKAKQDLERTIAMVKELLYNCTNSDSITPNILGANFIIENTPCGKTKICIRSDKKDFIVLISVDNNNRSKTVIDISNECKEFLEKFKS